MLNTYKSMPTSPYLNKDYVYANTSLLTLDSRYNFIFIGWW